jgi:hypothetical protein
MADKSLDQSLHTTLADYLGRQQFQAAEFLLDAMHASGKKSPDSLHLLAEAQLQQGKVSQAWGNTLAAINLQKDHGPATQLLKAIESAAVTYSVDGKQRAVGFTTAAEFLRLNPSRGKTSTATTLRIAGKPTPLLLHQLNDILVTGSEGVAFDPDSALFFKNSFQSTDPADISIRSIPLIPVISSAEAPLISGVCAHLCGQWSGNYFHWINELLTRAYLLLQLGFDGHFLTPAADHPFIRESLEMLGISAERIIPYDCQRGARCESLLMFDTFWFTHATENPEILLSLREKLIAQADRSIVLPPDVRGIYVRRTGLRSVQNESAVLQLCERHGILPIVAETLSFRTQIGLIASTRMLLGPHGSGLTNSLFMPSESAIIELLAARMINPCFHHIARIRNHRYYTVPSIPKEDNPDSERVEPVLTYLELTLEQELERRS